MLNEIRLAYSRSAEYSIVWYRSRYAGILDYLQQTISGTYTHTHIRGQSSAERRAYICCSYNCSILLLNAWKWANGQLVNVSNIPMPKLIVNVTNLKKNACEYIFFSFVPSLTSVKMLLWNMGDFVINWLVDKVYN